PEPGDALARATPPRRGEGAGRSAADGRDAARLPGPLVRRGGGHPAVLDAPGRTGRRGHARTTPGGEARQGHPLARLRPSAQRASPPHVPDIQFLKGNYRRVGKGASAPCPRGCATAATKDVGTAASPPLPTLRESPVYRFAWNST